MRHVTAEASSLSAGFVEPAIPNSVRALIDAAPFRESGHRHLMAALAARGNVAEALRAYDDLRVLLRDDLGAAPGAAIQALHERLLREGDAASGEAAPGDDVDDEPGGVTPRLEPREERRLISILAIELGVPRAALDPEQLRSLLAPQYARLQADLEGFGGTVDSVLGGVLLAVFGAPTAHEDDHERAVRAGLHSSPRRSCATSRPRPRAFPPASLNPRSRTASGR